MIKKYNLYCKELVQMLSNKRLHKEVSGTKELLEPIIDIIQALAKAHGTTTKNIIDDYFYNTNDYFSKN